MNSQGDGEKFKITTVTITLSSIALSAIQGIIGYVAVYFFKPMWEKTIIWLNQKKN